MTSENVGFPLSLSMSLFHLLLEPAPPLSRADVITTRSSSDLSSRFEETNLLLDQLCRFVLAPHTHPVRTVVRGYTRYGRTN